LGRVLKFPDLILKRPNRGGGYFIASAKKILFHGCPARGVAIGNDKIIYYCEYKKGTVTSGEWDIDKPGLEGAIRSGVLFYAGGRTRMLSTKKGRKGKKTSQSLKGRSGEKEPKEKEQHL